jgi:signal transduction histidine kinase
LSQAEKRDMELQRASRLKDEFLAALSHELRTPLNAILGWTQILQSSAEDPKVRRALSSIERNARSQARMIDDLLDLSRVVTGKLSLKTEVVDLRSVMHAAVEVIQPGAQAKSIAVTCTMPEQPVYALADSDRLQQVLWNLLSNSVKFTPQRGEIRLTLQAAEEDLVMTIQDTGIGIDPAFLPHVFDRFRQADGSMAREHGGLGLGLAIVHDVVVAHGGTVTAESEGRSRGATFTVRLPRAAQARPAPA